MYAIRSYYGAVVPGRAVGDTADALQISEVSVGVDVRAPLEEHVLEQVREARAAGSLVPRAHGVPEVDRHDRQAGIRRKHHAQSVVQSMPFESYFHHPRNNFV